MGIILIYKVGKIYTFHDEGNFNFLIDFMPYIIDYMIILLCLCDTFCLKKPLNYNGNVITISDYVFLCDRAYTKVVI